MLFMLRLHAKTFYCDFTFLNYNIPNIYELFYDFLRGKTSSAIKLCEFVWGSANVLFQNLSLGREKSIAKRKKFIIVLVGY